MPARPRNRRGYFWCSWDWESEQFATENWWTWHIYGWFTRERVYFSNIAMWVCLMATPSCWIKRIQLCSTNQTVAWTGTLNPQVLMYCTIKNTKFITTIQQPPKWDFRQSASSLGKIPSHQIKHGELIPLLQHLGHNYDRQIGGS